MKDRFWKKTASGLLALLITAGNMPALPLAQMFERTSITASAADNTQCGANATWAYNSTTKRLTITGTGAMADYSYFSQPWADYMNDITSVEIGQGITSIGKNAFDHCENMASVSIPDSVTSLGINAFYGCKGLESVTIPSSVTVIGNSAFAYYQSITSLTIPNSVTSMDEGAFSRCRNLTSVTIHGSITSISNNTFNFCIALKTVNIPDSVTSIGSSAFNNCVNLTTITIPAGVTSIGQSAFCYCIKLANVYCYADPDSLNWDGASFDDFIYDGSTVCYVSAEHYSGYFSKFGPNSDTPVNVTFCPAGKCGENATWKLDLTTGTLTISGTGDMYDYQENTSSLPWYSYGMTSVVIENGITSVGKYAFNGCNNLTSVDLPASLTSISESAFYNCMNLESVDLPANLTSIGDYAFYNCGKLESVDLPASLTSIGAWAFSSCQSLTSIEIPAGVRFIAGEAFYACSELANVYCYADPDSLSWDDDGGNAFKKDGTTVCHVPKKYYTKYSDKFGGSVNVTFKGDLVDMGLGVHLYGHSLTLNGSIGVNFYVSLPDALLESDTAKMVFTIPDGDEASELELFVKNVTEDESNKIEIDGKTYYKFRCGISAKDMASEITAQIVDGDKTGTAHTYSVKEYAEYLLSHTEEAGAYAQAAPLVKAMLNYGAASQFYFGVGSTPANASLDNNDKLPDAVDIPDTFRYNDENNTLPEGVTFAGATLSLKSETTLSLYFTGLSADCAFNCKDKTVETDSTKKYVIARIRGIRADELEDDFTVKFEDGYSVTYNVMTYCYNALNGGSEDDNLLNVCRALYLYAEAANAYSE